MNKLNLLLFTLGIVAWTTVFSQNFDWLNQVHVTGADGIYGSAMDLDNDGNLIIAGGFKGGVIDFDHGPGVTELNSVGNIYDDLFVMKVDQNGNFIWANRFGSVHPEAYSDLAVDDQNYIYTTGTFKEPANFLPYYPMGGKSDVFVQKLDPTGNQMWAVHFRGVDTDYSGNISVDGQGNVYVNGRFKDSIDVDPGTSDYFLNEDDNGRFFIVKLDSNGVFQWAQNYGDQYYYALSFPPGGMQVDNNDDIVLTGQIYDSHDFDRGPDTLLLGQHFRACVFVIKLDGAGNLIWGKEVIAVHPTGTINTGRINCFDLTIDPLNNITLLGEFQSLIDFDPGAGQELLYGTSTDDVFLLNLSSGGDFNWVKRIGPSNDPSNPNILLSPSVHAQGITSDLAGNIFVTGSFEDSTDFDGGATDYILDTEHLYSEDMFIVKYSNVGEFKGALRTEATTTNSWSRAHDLRIGQNDQIYTTGAFRHEVDFDPGIGQYITGQYAHRGIFVLALNQFELGVQNEEIDENFVYPNPTTDYIYFDEIVESIVLYNASGQTISQKTHSQMIDLSDQPPGVYTLLLNNRPYRVVKH